MSAEADYQKIKDACNKVFRETGRRDPKMWVDKAAAAQQAASERRAAAKRRKPALQEEYIRQFPSTQQKEVRMRLQEPERYWAMMARRRQGE